MITSIFLIIVFSMNILRKMLVKCGTNNIDADDKKLRCLLLHLE